jgi:hypothetical protein
MPMTLLARSTLAIGVLAVAEPAQTTLTGILSPEAVGEWLALAEDQAKPPVANHHVSVHARRHAGACWEQIQMQLGPG